jgi:hypothetical protein
MLLAAKAFLRSAAVTGLGSVAACRRRNAARRQRRNGRRDTGTRSPAARSGQFFPPLILREVLEAGRELLGDRVIALLSRPGGRGGV